ncbi:hypothetical protein [Gimesia aquarii]|uniref:Uncharacterized protein n=1 Tax=Gimesia aquarii TaxID=2527964 RepID=A0A517WQF7_9PLAN|nr:hypothetical protein [Gimesia aquarii]QDU07495.1 hypothetical protein V202x_08510 [Gimesia aquarii]
MRFNDLQTPNALQNHCLSGFTLRIGFWVPLLFVLTGCSSGPSENDLLEALEETAPHDLVCSSRVVEITEIKSLKEGQKWKVKFESRDTPAEPWLLPVDVPAELKKNVPDQESFQTAVEQFQQLRFPEKNKIQELHKELRAFRFPKVYREKYGVSDEVLWRGEGTLEKEGELFHLELTKVKSNEDLDFKQLTTKSKLSKQTAIADGSQNDPLIMYQEQQRNFVDAVKSSRQKMEARLAAEKTNLETLVTHPVRLQGVFKNGTAKSINLNFEFEQNRDKHSLSAVAIDSDEIISRVVFSGSLLLPDVSERNSFASRNVHDGWVLTLKNEDFKLSELAKTFPRGMVIYYDQPTAQFRLANRNSAFDFSAERETQPENNSTQLLEARILKGAQSSGKEKINSMPDRLLQMTNMEFDPARNLFRIVIQEKDNPFLSAVFEGVRRTDPPHHLGIPIQLKQVSFSHLSPNGNKTRTNLFSKQSGTLLLVPTKAGWQGVIGDAKLTFQIEKDRLTLPSALERWKQALQPGTQWSGPLYWKNDPEEALRMRIADYRPDQNYVRLVLKKKSDARQYVVYEGSLQKESGTIDGFGLVMQQRGQSSFVDKISDGVFFNQYVYSGGRVWNIDWDHKVFRLSPDGKQMYAYSLRGQRTILTKDEAVKPSHQLKTAEFQKLWRSALSTTILWKGVLTAPKTNSSVEILAKIRSYEPTTNTVELVLEVKGNSKIKANYKGTLVTTENMINGYALNLKKMTGVNSTSHFFDTYNLGSRKVQFRLNETGTKMYGRLTDFQYDDPEFIELEASTGK